MVSSLMYDQQFEAAMDKVANRFLFTVVLARRVAQLKKGAEPLVDSNGLDTYEEIVFQEILDDKLEWRATSSLADLGDMEPEYGESEFEDGE
ncbi:MAG: DNA-directed RNA polymerase subunit omega [Nitrospinaceae bacterium]|jgi:DNA-directed RNA polymerase subunit K/omega|nr:DNA-directed RNA polymerase subunit omega [Nitrospinaceae bacterium]MBT3432794.1 DNA-directed RNA polymerase subunit omega [Nitrospinaceae bacterium]MBT3820132.1 DNA-directed RNA polymerase subunit omega [Nitrospinaceae bacterium]MBT4092998.1 DNA-directed RNA polymerase subunit omega [Nitrospinaceae bacterium]MBT4431138.1 DNA-directed RNA polymerase subunit omega [Nitrospinaceae bacterium]